MYHNPLEGLTPEDILEYLRKSRSDDPILTVEEVLANHEKILDEWAERNLGREVPEKNKFREVVSGETIDDRPEIKKLLKMIESPRYKAILIVEVQRLSRGDLEDAGRLIKLLRYSNTLVITPQKTYDLRDEYDRDAFERELKRGNEYLEYTKKIMDRGKLLSVSQGNYLGSTPPYGYNRCWVKDGKKKCPTLTPNEFEADIVRNIFDMYANQGMGATSICDYLEEMHIKAPSGGKKWSTYVVYSMLENVHYLGKVRWNWRKTIRTISEQEIVESRPKAKIGEYLIYDGKHPAIISEELFEKAASVRGGKPKTKNDTTLKCPVAGLMRCSCGEIMLMNTYIKRGIEFARPKMACANQRKCKTGSVDLSEIIEKVKDALRECIADFEVRIDKKQDDSLELHKSLIAKLESKKKELEKKELEQWELRSSGEMPKAIFDKLNAKVLQEKEEVQQALCTAYESMPEPVDYKERVILFSEALAALEDEKVPGKIKNEYLKKVIERIEYKRPPNARKKQLSEAELKKATHTGQGWYSLPFELHIIIKP